MKGLGYIPDLAGRLRTYSAVKAIASGPAKARAILSILPPRKDQGTVGRCVGATKVGQVYVATAKKGAPFHGSMDDLYYYARLKRGWQNSDSGCMPSDANEVLANRGLVPESLRPQDALAWNVPTPGDYAAVAERHQSLEWLDLHSFDEACATIDADEPGGCAMTWRGRYDTGAVATTGILPDDRLGNDVRGGHETLRVGYEAELTLPGWSKPGFLIDQNSWGEWGASLVALYTSLLGEAHPYVAHLRTIPGTELRTFFFLARELVDSDDVSDLDALVDVETVS